MFAIITNTKKLLLLCASIALLASCGYKDDLYLPKNNTNINSSETASQPQNE